MLGSNSVNRKTWQATLPACSRTPRAYDTPKETPSNPSQSGNVNKLSKVVALTAKILTRSKSGVHYTILPDCLGKLEG